MNRQEFENIPDVAKIFENLHPTIIWFCEQSNTYATSFDGFKDRVTWLNGAWSLFNSETTQAYADIETYANAYENEKSWRIAVCNKLHEKDVKIAKLKSVISNFKHSDHIMHVDDFIKELEEVLDESN